MDVKIDVIPMTSQLQWIWTHQYSLEFDVPTLRKTRIALRKKANALITIREAIWHVNVQRRSSNLDNLAKPITTDLDIINFAPNLILSSKRSLLD